MGATCNLPSLDSQTLRAVVETIFPSAVMARVPDFILKNLKSADEEEIYKFREGFEKINTIAWQHYNNLFAYLTVNERIIVLKKIEDTEFFDVMRSYTMEGMFADPIYGGNRDMVGWKLIGFPGSRFHPLTHLSRGWKASVFVSLTDKERLREDER